MCFGSQNKFQASAAPKAPASAEERGARGGEEGGGGAKP